ncbi:hypothetical protein [Nonomuraea sp. bgisy101]|uniref:hypothetical protein n=1 Tax=Nonomuraea sp. bgisy101 TaxID=3413784 RepID=UPI003D705685
MAQVIAELLTQPREPDAVAVPREKLGTDGAFLLLDRLADPGHRDVQPLGGTAEVWASHQHGSGPISRSGEDRRAAHRHGRQQHDS